MKAIMIFILTTVVMYLFGAFIAGDFNSNNWNAVNKFYGCMIDVVVSVIIVSASGIPTSPTKGN